MKTDTKSTRRLAALLMKAIRIATEAHDGIINKDNTPYILHPMRLMLRSRTDEERIVSILHDTLEDTMLTREELESEDFPARLLDALDGVTKIEGEEYGNFIIRSSRNDISRAVKLLDLYDNIDVTRLDTLGDWELKRTAKYHRAIKYLEGNTSGDDVADARYIQDGRSSA